MANNNRVSNQAAVARRRPARREFVPIIGLVPGNSFFHRLHAAPKMLWAFTVILFAFLIRNVTILLILAAVGCLLVYLSGTWYSFWRAILVIAAVLFAMIFFQSVAPAYPQPWTPIVPIGPLTVYQEGIYSGFVFSSRIIVGSSFGLLVILTTHPADIFLVFRRFGVPYELSFMTLTTLQLIPILQREFIIVMSAQQSRGLKAQGFGALLPSVVPVFAGSFERVRQLAMSLESRAFGSSGKKTSLRENAPRPLDYALSALGVVALIAVITFIIMVGNLDYSDAVFYPTWFALLMTVGSFVGFIGLVFRFVLAVRT